VTVRITYSTGKVSVTNGSLIATGSNGALWSDVIEGDWLRLTSTGRINIIASVNDTLDEITFQDAWDGDTAIDASYRIIRASPLRSDTATTQAQVRKLIDDIEAAGTFLFVYGAEPDPARGEEGQFAIKVNDETSNWKLWYRTGGVWVFKGSPAGFAWKGVWSLATAYYTNDVVSRLNKSYISKLGSTNQPPESSPTYWDIFTAGGDRYDIAVWASVRPDSGEHLVQVVLPTPVAYYIGLTDSAARADTAATASTVFSICKNNTQFATLTFAPGATVGVFACATQTAFAAGDKLSIIAPNPRDATLGDISITLTGFR
jgi:hypothetical protein